MRELPIPANEDQRIARLEELLVLDSEPEPVFDSITRLAAKTCGVPVALISLIDAKRQWFKSSFGLSGIKETPREHALCAYTILSDELLEVPDTTRDPRFCTSPYVTGKPEVRFYAGVPLVLPTGERVGSLCVIDTRIRQLDAGQADTLRSLATVAIQALTMRRDLITRTLAARSDYERDLAQDISALQQARDALRRVMDDQDAILNTDLIGILKLRERRIAWANTGAETLFGYARGEMLGQSVRILYPDEEDFQRRGEEAYPQIQVGKLYRTQIEFVRKDGQRLFVDTSVTALPEAPHDPLCMFLDISPLKRAEQVRLRAIALEAENRQLAEANRVKSLFLSNMSHEFLTPLNAVIGYAQLLQGGRLPADSQKFQGYLAHIGTSGKQLMHLIGTVLNYAKLESGKIRFEPEALDLKRVIDDVVEVHQASLAERRMSIEVQVETRELVADGLRLSQMISNYLSNAIKFSRAGGHVAIRATAVNDATVRIEVEDAGIGIADQDLEKLFSPFQQLSEGNARTHGGAGLGLALTQRLCEAHGGTVGVSSRPGMGSIFWLELPAKGL